MCLAVPARVLFFEDGDPLLRMARVDFGGVFKVVSLAYVDDAKVGDYVLVHVGFAIARLDEAEAERVLASLDELGELVDPDDLDAEHPDETP